MNNGQWCPHPRNMPDQHISMVCNKEFSSIETGISPVALRLHQTSQLVNQCNILISRNETENRLIDH